jgi:hypothetical protein
MTTATPIRIVLADPLLCVSAGKAYRPDETAMIATPVLDANLHNFSFAIGASQKLTNGNYHFDSGFMGRFHVAHKKSILEGNIVSSWKRAPELIARSDCGHAASPPEG